MAPLYFEDFAVGQRYRSSSRRITVDDITRFASEFDPQPFHLDDEAARASIFGGLAASGWHTAALTMKLLVGSEFSPAGGIIGMGFEELRWPRPVRPGDELHTDVEVLEVRPSKSNASRGLVKIRTTTINQHGEAVQVSIGTVLVPRRS
jgi:acyl dehydratase